MIERVEKRSSSSLRKTIRAYLGASLRLGLGSFADTCFFIRAIRAPEGQIVRGDKVRVKGRVVKYSGEINVILTDEGYRVFPNKLAGDTIETPSNK